MALTANLFAQSRAICVQAGICVKVEPPKPLIFKSNCAKTSQNL